MEIVQSDCRILNHKGKIVSDTTTFSWLWPVLPHVQSDCRIVEHQYLWKESSDILDFLHGDNHQWKVAPETIFWLDVVWYAFCPNRLQGSLFINVSGGNQMMSWICLHDSH